MSRPTIIAVKTSNLIHVKLSVTEDFKHLVHFGKLKNLNCIREPTEIRRFIKKVNNVIVIAGVSRRRAELSGKTLRKMVTIY